MRCEANKFNNGVLALLLFATLLAGGLSPASAGDLYRLDFRFEETVPTFPVHVTLNAYKDDNDLKGVSEADFDGSTMYGLACDAYACITEITVDGDSLTVHFEVSGWKAGGDFDANSTFEILLGEESHRLAFHTSCSQPIYMGLPLEADPSGIFVIEGGDGECLLNPGDCPSGDDLYWLGGLFEIPCSGPADLIFRVYENDDHLKGTSTAHFDGSGLTGIVCDAVACLEDASASGGNLEIDWLATGFDHGHFKANTRLEVEVVGCGVYHLDLHTSCSQPLYFGTTYDVEPDGQATLLDGCGCILEEGDCPDENKLYRLDGTFLLDCFAPVELTFRVYKDGHDLKGESSAIFDGSSLSSLVCDEIACIDGARQNGGILEVDWIANGHHNGHFDANTRFEIEVSSCGVFYKDLHTSCSDPIYFDVIFDLDTEGQYVLTDGCGGCVDESVMVRESTWSKVKTLY
jgi:hypothetical protein